MQTFNHDEIDYLFWKPRAKRKFSTLIRNNSESNKDRDRQLICWEYQLVNSIGAQLCANSFPRIKPNNFHEKHRSSVYTSLKNYYHNVRLFAFHFLRIIFDWNNADRMSNCRHIESKEWKLNKQQKKNNWENHRVFYNNVVAS